MRVIVQVFHQDFTTTPLTDGGRDEFAAYTAAIARDNPTIRDFVIGNEPNLNRFWMPQFALTGEPVAGGVPRAAGSDYDELKKVSPKAQVIGGAVSPRGGDQAGGIRPTHSPTDVHHRARRRYRPSRRKLPIMDSFAIHPYQDNSSTPPSFAHPLQHDDRDRRLRQARHPARPGVRRHCRSRARRCPSSTGSSASRR